MISLQHLEMIAAIHRAGGFRGAARELKISQPTLSKAIMRLESRLGFTLFERTPTGARPTPAADHLAKGAEPLIRGAERLLDEARRRQESDDGRLRLGIGSVVKHVFMPDLERQIRQRFPNIHYHFSHDVAEDLIKLAKARKIDAVFVYHEIARRHEDLIRAKIFEAEIAVIARNGHPLCNAGSVSQKALRDFPFALPGVPPQVIEWLEIPVEAMFDCGVALESDNYDVLIDQVEQSDYLTMAPEFFFSGKLAEGRIVTIPTVKPSLIYECWMLATVEFARTSMFSTVAEIARDMCRTARP
ncbi:MAG: LysR family transcriptional regulator [Sphingomonadales bacterium]|nr:LysR family transcriptional regulator [Sphingomonadales bacterium]MDE2569783.1 LysR family transcriptional regulator [Sphingomonadales bacterium]